MHKTNNKFPPAYNRYIGIEKKTQKIRQITTFNIGDENSECLNLVSHCLVYVTTTQHIFWVHDIFGFSKMDEQCSLNTPASL